MPSFRRSFLQLAVLVRRLFLVLGFIILLCLNSAFAQYSYNFRTTESKVAYLNYLRQTLPELYQDFVGRYNAMEFLDDIQEGIDHLKFEVRPVQGLQWSVYEPAADEKKLIIDSDLVKKELRNFIESFPDSNQKLEPTLSKYIKASSLLEALTAGLAQTRNAPGVRDALKLPVQQRYEALQRILTPLSEMEGVNPRLLGLSQESISGIEFLSLYQVALQSREKSIRLMWLVRLLLDQNDLQSSVRKAWELSVNLPSSQYQSKLQVPVAAIVSLNPSDLKKLNQNADSKLKDFGSWKSVSNRNFRFKIQRGHPLAMLPRGSVGDCSTTNCALIPLAKNEELYWILRPNGTVKGYLQFTRVMADGRPILYVNTISGSGMSSRDTLAVLSTLAQDIDALRAEGLAIPLEEKFAAIINFPEVAKALSTLVPDSKKVALNYLDIHDRKALAPLIEDSLDMPESNKMALLLPLQKLKNLPNLVERSAVKIEPNALFASVSQNDALMIAIELRNREENAADIKKVLQSFNIDPKKFESLWFILSNKSKYPVAKFHAGLMEKIQAMGLHFEWKDLVSSPFLLKGHMEAPDALEGPNANLALRYIEFYIRAKSDVDSIYKSIAPHFNSLIQKPAFMQMVRQVFHLNIEEFDKLLDYYELEHRSAYSTLTFLFENGLPASAFKAEITDLENTRENAYPEISRKNGIFIRRTTLLGILHNYHRQYFLRLMNHLEKVALEYSKLSDEDRPQLLADDEIRIAARYIAKMVNLDRIGPGDMQRIDRFFISSKLGFNFLSHLGIFSTEKFNVPKYVDVLFTAGEFEKAAYLIHKGSWVYHPKVSEWMATLWENRNSLSPDLILAGFKMNPAWLQAPGIDSFLDDLMLRCEGNLQNENALAKIFISFPQRLTPARIEWMKKIDNPELQSEIPNLSSSTNSANFSQSSGVKSCKQLLKE